MFCCLVDRKQKIVKKKKGCVHRDRHAVLLYTIYCSTHCGACSDCRIESSHITVKQVHKEPTTSPLYYERKLFVCFFFLG